MNGAPVGAADEMGIEFSFCTIPKEREERDNFDTDDSSREQTEISVAVFDIVTGCSM